MDFRKPLSRSEFDVMHIAWGKKPPITAALILGEMSEKKDWKLATATTLLIRLVEKGFLRSEKVRRARFFYPIASKEDYVAYETKQFMERYHNNSVESFLESLYADLDPADIDARSNQIIKTIDRLNAKTSVV